MGKPIYRELNKSIETHKENEYQKWTSLILALSQAQRNNNTMWEKLASQINSTRTSSSFKMSILGILWIPHWIRIIRSLFH